MSFAMGKLHKDIIQAKKKDMLDNIYPTPGFWALLESKELFSPEMVRQIQGMNKTDIEQVDEMLNKLTGRGPNSFDLFTQVLVESDHGHVATILKEAEAHADLLQQQRFPLLPNENLRVQRTQQTLNIFMECHKKMYEFYKNKEQEKMNTLSDTNKELEKLVESQKAVLEIFAKLCESAADIPTAQVDGHYKDKVKAMEDLQKRCDDNTKDAIAKFQNGFEKLLTRLKKNFEESSKCVGCAKQSIKCECVLKEKLQSVKTQWSVCKQNISSDDQAEEKANELTSALDQLSSVVDNHIKKMQLLKDGVSGVVHNVGQMEYYYQEMEQANSAISKLKKETRTPRSNDRHQEQLTRQLETKQKQGRDNYEDMRRQLKSACAKRPKLLELISPTSPTTTTTNNVEPHTDGQLPNTLQATKTDTSNAATKTDKQLPTKTLPKPLPYTQKEESIKPRNKPAFEPMHKTCPKPNGATALSATKPLLDAQKDRIMLGNKTKSEPLKKAYPKTNGATALNTQTDDKPLPYTQNYLRELQNKHRREPLNKECPKPNGATALSATKPLSNTQKARRVIESRLKASKTDNNPRRMGPFSNYESRTSFNNWTIKRQDNDSSHVRLLPAIKPSHSVDLRSDQQAVTSTLKLDLPMITKSDSTLCITITNLQKNTLKDQYSQMQSLSSFTGNGNEGLLTLSYVKLCIVIKTKLLNHQRRNR